MTFSSTQYLRILVGIGSGLDDFNLTFVILYESQGEVGAEQTKISSSIRVAGSEFGEAHAMYRGRRTSLSVSADRRYFPALRQRRFPNRVLYFLQTKSSVSPAPVTGIYRLRRTQVARLAPSLEMSHAAARRRLCACWPSASLSTTEPPPFCHSLPPFPAVNLRSGHASFAGKMLVSPPARARAPVYACERNAEKFYAIKQFCLVSLLDEK